MTQQRKAILYRMVLPDHVCPFGVRAKLLLEQSGFEVEDNILETRIDVDVFKDKHGVSTTPQAFIDGRLIGGSQELALYLAEVDAAA